MILVSHDTEFVAGARADEGAAAARRSARLLQRRLARAGVARLTPLVGQAGPVQLEGLGRIRDRRWLGDRSRDLRAVRRRGRLGRSSPTSTVRRRLASWHRRCAQRARSTLDVTDSAAVDREVAGLERLDVLVTSAGVDDPPLKAELARQIGAGEPVDITSAMTDEPVAPHADRQPRRHVLLRAGRAAGDAARRAWIDRHHRVVGRGGPARWAWSTTPRRRPG